MVHATCILGLEKLHFFVPEITQLPDYFAIEKNIIHLFRDENVGNGTGAKQKKTHAGLGAHPGWRRGQVAEKALPLLSAALVPAIFK